MPNKNICNIEENIYISLILTFIGGFLDAYTYILYDGIFANTQTGNIIFLSIHLVEGDFYKALLRFLPILSFCLAVFVTQFFIHKFKKNKRWLKIILSINILITSIIGLGVFKNYYIIIVCLISFICSLMISTFKKSKGDVFAPIMCTGNLRSFVEFLYKWVAYKDNDAKKVLLKYFFIVFSFMFGVSFGVIIVHYFFTYSLYICTGLFFIIFLIIIYNQRI